MEKIATCISDILCDYHNYQGFKFTDERILEWVSQFEESDREFLLTEFLYLLKQGIYYSEDKCIDVMINNIESLAKTYRFKSVIEFLKNVEFLRTQPPLKSQDKLLEVLENKLRNKYGISFKQCGISSKKYAIYIDDIIATGGTLFADTCKWLKEINTDGETNLLKVISKEKVLIVTVFCKHNWTNIEWRLKLEFKTDKILNKINFQCDYEIQNSPTYPASPKFNFAYPIDYKSKTVNDYLASLNCENKRAYAFRNSTMPTKEVLYSSPANRDKFEKIILLKGIELLKKAKDLKMNHRPLGVTSPSYQTFGTGTLFFTWRNISNTTPIVFWWGAGDWLPLFPLYNRGNLNVLKGRLNQK